MAANITIFSPLHSQHEFNFSTEQKARNLSEKGGEREQNAYPYIQNTNQKKTTTILNKLKFQVGQFCIIFVRCFLLFFIIAISFFFLHSCGSLNIYHHYANGRAVSVAYNFLTLLLLCFWLWRHRLFCVFVLLMLGYRLFTCLQLSYNWCASRVTELEHGITIDIFSLFSINRKKNRRHYSMRNWSLSARVAFMFSLFKLAIDFEMRVQYAYEIKHNETKQ